MDLKRIARWVAPRGAMGILEYAERFRRLGLPATWGLDRRRKHALDKSRIELLPAFVRARPGVAIDVGANAGSWSVAVMEMLSAERLLAFEPEPRTFARLESSLAPFPKARAFNVALGSEEKTLSLIVQPAADMSSFLPLREDIRRGYGLSEETRRVEVPVHTLDSFTSDVDRVGILKLDVQGFEAEVVRGAAQTLAKTDCVLVEVNYASHYEGDLTFDGTHRMLSERGFRVWGISPAFEGRDGQPMWADAVYVRGDRASA